MAKHAHRLILMNKKTWKCTLEGCSFFVHLGLAHILEGKQALCWECNESFTVDGYALREEMPKCSECRSPIKEVPANLSELDKARATISRFGVTRASDLNEAQRGVLKILKTDISALDEYEKMNPDEPTSE